MQKERRTYGSISDGYEKRYLIFWLYFVLGELKGASAYIRWYEKTLKAISANQSTNYAAR